MTGKRSWLGRLEEQLKTFYGPAELREAGKPRERSANRMDGVQGDFEMHRGPDGRTYLVARPKGATPPVDGDAPQSRP